MRYPGVKSIGHGRYKIRATIICPKTGKRKDTERMIEAKNTAEAFQKREELRIKLQSAHDPHASRLRLGEYAELWMRSKLRELKPSTRRHYASILDLHILPHLGDYYADAITPADVVRWRDRQPGRPRTVNSRLAVLRALLRSAHEELELPRDPYGRTKQVSLDEREPRDFRPEELRAILGWVREHEPRWYPLLLTLTFTAARFGEIAALQWGDIDWQNREIRISRSVWRGHVSTTKTGSVRRVPLLPAVDAVLRAHRREPVWGLPNGTGEDLVFCSRRGTHHVPSGFNPVLHRAVEALGLPRRRGGAHRLRHSANNLLRQVTGAEVVRSITGHEDSAMTWHYSHIQADEKNSAMLRVYDRVVGASSEVDVGVGVGSHSLAGNVIPLKPRTH
jgi:integrase